MQNRTGKVRAETLEEVGVMSTETTQPNIVRAHTGILALMRAWRLARWAGHAWATYPDWEALEKIARESDVAEWPDRIEQVTKAAMEEAALRNPVARQVIFLAGRLAPDVYGPGANPLGEAPADCVGVSVGSYDQLKAYVADTSDTYVYKGRRRRAVMLEVQYDEWGDAVAARFAMAKAARGRDIARVVSAALAANRGAKYAIQDALGAVLSRKRAAEFAVRILDANNAGHILAR